jgi:transposase
LVGANQYNRLNYNYLHGICKEHRPDPIIQMGLFMDTDGIPLTYGLYPGNMLDKQTLIPMIQTIRTDYTLGRIIIVADRGMMAGDNIRQILIDKNGYVLSYSIRGADTAFKEYVLDEDGSGNRKNDGYYAIVTSELDTEDKKIIEIYRGLWRIEESFRITKSALQTRPIYLSRKDHIEAHFLICFIALVIARLLEKRLERKYSVSAILESLNRCSCSLLEQNRNRVGNPAIEPGFPTRFFLTAKVRKYLKKNLDHGSLKAKIS